MKGATILTIIAIAFIVLAVYLVASMQGDKYKETCLQSKGTPVYNGRFWECIK